MDRLDDIGGLILRWDLWPVSSANNCSIPRGEPFPLSSQEDGRGGAFSGWLYRDFECRAQSAISSASNMSMPFVVHVGGGVDHVHASLQGGDERIAAGAWVQTRCGADVRHLGNPELFGDVGVGRCLGARDFLAGDAGLDLVDGTFVTWMPTPAAIDQRAQLVEDKQGSGYSGDSGSAESRDIHRLGRWEVRPPMRWPWTSPVRSSSTRPCPMTRVGSGSPRFPFLAWEDPPRRGPARHYRQRVICPVPSSTSLGTVRGRWIWASFG